MSLAIKLHYALIEVNILPSNEAADLIASFMGKSERTIREGKYFIVNGCSFPENPQGKYRREGILRQNKEISEATSKYIRSSAVVKGKPNMTAVGFVFGLMNPCFPPALWSQDTQA